MVQSLAPEVIVMDVMLPHKDGVDACREIMQLRPDTRVLMLTASTTPPPQRMRSSRQSPPERRATCRRTRGLRSWRRRSGMWPRAFCAFRTGPSGGSSPWSAASRQPGLGRDDRGRAGNPDDVCQRQVIRPDRRAQGDQDRGRQERCLPHSGQSGSPFETGARGLGRAERTAE